MAASLRHARGLSGGGAARCPKALDVLLHVSLLLFPPNAGVAHKPL